MKLCILFTALLSAALPLQAGMMFTIDPTLATPINAGTYPGGTRLYIATTGTVNLDGPIGNPDGLVVTNPDGSLAAFPLPSCGPCWAPGYQYFLAGSNMYPTVAGGDGINHFPGGGGNYDLFPSGSPWAPEGKQTTDTQDPAAIRFGALAGTFNPNPVAADWFPVGYGGTFVTPAGGATLLLVLADTNYANNSGGFTVTVDPLPEPAAIWLAFSGFAVLGLPRAFRRLSRKQ